MISSAYNYVSSTVSSGFSRVSAYVTPKAAVVVGLAVAALALLAAAIRRCRPNWSLLNRADARKPVEQQQPQDTNNSVDTTSKKETDDVDL